MRIDGRRKEENIWKKEEHEGRRKKEELTSPHTFFRMPYISISLQTSSSIFLLSFSTPQVFARVS